MLLKVEDLKTFKLVLCNMNNIFRRRTLLKKMRERRDFHSVEMRPGEEMLPYIIEVKELGSILKSMQSTVDD